MASREHLLTSSALRYQRRNLFARRHEAVDLLGLPSSAAPSIRERVCRAWPLTLALIVAAMTVAAIVVTRDQMVDHAVGLRDNLVGAMLVSSQVVADTIQDMIVNTTQTLQDSVATNGSMSLS